FLSANQADAPAPADSPAHLRPRGRHMVDRWIFSRLNAVAAQLQRSLEEYRFHEAADTLYHFFWHEFCDWYIELTKLRLQAGDPEAVPNLLVAFDGALRLLHPVMPFITEELWTALHAAAPPAVSIALAPFPQPDPAAVDPEAEAALAALTPTSRASPSWAKNLPRILPRSKPGAKNAAPNLPPKFTRSVSCSPTTASAPRLPPPWCPPKKPSSSNSKPNWRR